jgi:hypothetical protein
MLAMRGLARTGSAWMRALPRFDGWHRCTSPDRSARALPVDRAARCDDTTQASPRAGRSGEPDGGWIDPASWLTGRRETVWSRYPAGGAFMRGDRPPGREDAT